MKKVLSSLLLLFILSFQINSSGVNYLKYSEKRVNEIIENLNLRQKIRERIKEIDSVTYSSLDSLPTGSPLKPHDIRQISSDYGMRIHPILGLYLMHKGLDITAYRGAPIFSTANGVVEEINHSRFGYGNEVVIRHSNGYKTRYAHLLTISINVGDSILKGQEIGTLGRTGLTTGEHLHYEVIKDGKQIDPMFFTYQSTKDRSIKNYISTLITLELA